MKQQEYIAMGVIGLEIWIESEVDLTTATDIKIRYQKPDGTIGEWAATELTKVEGTQTKYGAAYVTQAVGDLDQSGGWYVQLDVSISGFVGLGKQVPLEVSEPIAAP